MDVSIEDYLKMAVIWTVALEVELGPSKDVRY